MRKTLLHCVLAVICASTTPQCFTVIVEAETFISPDGKQQLLVGSDFHLDHPGFDDIEQVNDYLKYVQTLPKDSFLTLIENGYGHDDEYVVNYVGTQMPAGVIDWKPEDTLLASVRKKFDQLCDNFYELLLGRPYEDQGFLFYIYNKFKRKNVPIQDIEFRHFVQTYYPLKINLRVINQEAEILKRQVSSLNILQEADFSEVKTLNERMKKYDSMLKLAEVPGNFYSFQDKCDQKTYQPTSLDDLLDGELVEETTSTLLEHKALVQITLNKKCAHMALFMGRAHTTRLRPRLIAAGWKSTKKSGTYSPGAKYQIFVNLKTHLTQTTT